MAFGEIRDTLLVAVVIVLLVMAIVVATGSADPKWGTCAALVGSAIGFVLLGLRDGKTFGGGYRSDTDTVWAAYHALIKKGFDIDITKDTETSTPLDIDYDLVFDGVKDRVSEIDGEGGGKTVLKFVSETVQANASAKAAVEQDPAKKAEILAKLEADKVKLAEIYAGMIDLPITYTSEQIKNIHNGYGLLKKEYDACDSRYVREGENMCRIVPDKILHNN
jgi:hypothetical protein